MRGIVWFTIGLPLFNSCTEFVFALWRQSFDPFLRVLKNMVIIACCQLDASTLWTRSVESEEKRQYHFSDINWAKGQNISHF